MILLVKLVRSGSYIVIFNILTGQKRHMTEMKFLWPVNTTGNSSNLCRALVCLEMLHVVEDVLPSSSK